MKRPNATIVMDALFLNIPVELFGHKVLLSDDNDLVVEAVQLGRNGQDNKPAYVRLNMGGTTFQEFINACDAIPETTIAALTCNITLTRLKMAAARR